MNELGRLERFLRHSDEVSLPARLFRLDLLVAMFGENRQLLLPDMSYRYFEEVKLCFLNGCFVATVLMAQAALEEILRSHCRMKGDDRTATSCGFKELIDKCNESGFLPADVADGMHAVREIRNPYMHTKGVVHPTSLHRRIVASNFEKNETDIMFDDAKRAMEVLFDLLKRYPFTLPLEDEQA